MKRLLLFFVLISSFCQAATVFVSQSGGSVSCGADGTQSTTAVASVTWTAGNTYNLCGTITSDINPSASGASGSPITIVFESGAQIAPADCGTNACMDLTGRSWITIDFGINGKISPTANGNGLANNNASHGIILTGGSNIEVKGTPGGTGGIFNVYQYTCCTAGAGGTTTGVRFDNANNINIHHFTIDNVELGVYGSFEPAGSSNWNISNMLTTHTRGAVWWGDGNGNSTLTGTNTIHDNDMPNGCNFAVPLGSWCQHNINGFHLEQVHIFAVNASNSSITGLQVYNNWFHGDMSTYANGVGGCTSSFNCSDSTAMLFIEAQSCSGNPCVSGFVYNNLFQIEAGQVSDGMLDYQSNLDNGTTTFGTYNNVFDAKTNTINTSPISFAGGVRNHTFQNNIVENGLTLIYNPNSSATFTSINNNIEFNEGSFGWLWHGGSQIHTFAGWQAACACDAASLHTSPLLNTDYTLTSGSPARNLGLNKTSLGITALNFTKPTTIGIAGSSGSVARPSSGTWDTGIYQFTGAPGPPTATLSANSLTYAAQAIGTTSTAQSITVTNTGGLALNITSIALIGLDFYRVDNCPSILNAGSFCTVSIYFLPLNTGTRTATLTFVDDAANTPQVVNISGIGKKNLPSSVTLGIHALNLASASRPITLFTVAGITTITSIATTGDFTQTNDCGGTLAALAACTINITFTPTVVGTRTGNLTITDSDTGSPFVIPLSGTGVKTSMESKSFDYGEVYLSPTGDDSNPCTLAEPCKTLERGRDAIRGIVGRRHVVMLRGGTYVRPYTWTLDSTDSGTSLASRVVYAAYPGETPIISGGVNISGSVSAAWQDDGLICGANCRAWHKDLNSAQVRYFETLFYKGPQDTQSSVRRPRPFKGGTVNGYSKNTCPTTSIAPLCVAGSTQSVASANCGCPADVTASGNECAILSTPCTTASGLPYMCKNRFMGASADLPVTLHSINLGDIEIANFEKWSMSRLRIRSCTTVATDSVCQLKGPSSLSDGDTGCIHDTGVTTGHAYFLDNVKENLAKGQWYLDRCKDNQASCTDATNPTPQATWRITIYADTARNENPNVDEVIIPQLDLASPKILNAVGLQNAVFQGITFQHDGWMPSSFGLGDSQSIPLVPAAVSFTDVNGVLIDGVTVAKVNAWGIEIRGTSGGKKTPNKILNSAVYDVGAGGIRVGMRACTQGGNPSLSPAAHCQGADTNTNVPSYTTIKNNVVENYGQIQPTGEGTGIFIGDAHDNDVIYNRVYGGYGGGINLGYGLKRGADNGSTTCQLFTYNNTIGYNDIAGRCNGAACTGLLNDFGGIYAAASLSCLAPTQGAPASLTDYANRIINNRIHDLPFNYDNSTNQGSQGIYLDQGTSATLIQNNLVYRIAHTCVFLNVPQQQGPNQTLSQYNLVDNNIFAGCGAVQANRQRIVQRGNPNTLDNPPFGISNSNAFTWTHNIGYYNAAFGATSRPVGVPGGWGCFDDTGTSVAGTVDCTTRFNFNHNSWWNVATNNVLEFATCRSSACGSPYNSTNYFIYTSSVNPPTLPPSCWTLPFGTDCGGGILAAGEDAGSVARNPLFVAPVYGTDDWHMNASFVDIGFTVFDYTQAGRLLPVITVPTNIPQTYPLRTINSSTDYLP